MSYQGRGGRGAARRTVAAPKHSAANSHLENDKYMQDWEKAYAALQALNMDPDSPYSDYTRPESSAGQQPGQLAAARSRPSATNKPNSALTSGSNSRASAGQVRSYRATGAAARGVSGSIPERWPSAVLASWHKGPKNAEGVMCDVSDRPVLCSSAHWQRGEVVIGCSDHALYIIDAVKGTHKRTLYTKTCGHSEWVTCCTYLPSGQVVSGGMDSNLWVWPAGGVRGYELHGHGGPISQVALDPSSGLLASASYDKQIKLWSIGGGHGSEAGALIGHEAPVLEMEISPDGLVLTGDRSGHLMVWDSGTCTEAWHLKRVHQGHITSLAWFGYEDGACAGCFATGGQDGVVRVWDARERSCIAKQELHVNTQGRGAVGDLAAGGQAAGGMLISAGADGTLCICEPRKSFALMNQIKLSNFPYSMAVAGGLALVGLGDGSLWVVHINSGEVCYCLGANKHAVRCIEACEDRLLASGDDGKVLLWNFA